MSEEGKKIYSNIFIANAIYPEAKSIFSFHLEPIEKIKDHCYFVLDTNVLLSAALNPAGRCNSKLCATAAAIYLTMTLACTLV